MSHTYIGQASVVGALGLALADALAAATERAGAPGTSAAALVAVGGPAAGASIDALARNLGLSHSGAVRLVDRLERSSLVERRLGADGRAVSLWLTPEGRRVARRVLAQREAALAEALAPLDAEDRSALARLASAVLAGITPDRATGARICRLCDGDACGRPRGRCPVARAEVAAAAGAVGEAVND